MSLIEEESSKVNEYTDMKMNEIYLKSPMGKV